MILPAAFDLFAPEMTVRLARKAPSSSGSCDTCGRLNGCNSPKFPVYGEGRKGILIVLEAPGPDDDASSNALSGASGLLLRKELRKHGLDPFLDCWTTYAVRCYSKTKPTGAQVATCRGFTSQDIARLKPRIILPMGINAVTAVLDDRLRGRMTGTKPTAFFGCRIPDQEYRCWVCPTESPVYISDMEQKRDIYDIWAKDIEAALSVGEWKEAPRDDIRLCYTAQEAVEAIKHIHRTARDGCHEVTLDLETTGIKPHRKGHRILCASLSVNGTAWAFPDFQDEQFHKAMKDLLTDPNVGICAHQAQFEATWVHWIWGYWITCWAGDTCLDAHILRNQAPTNLKFCVYTTQGIVGYDSLADSYIKATAEEEEAYGNNAFNRMHLCPLPGMLEYCAKDSLYSERLRNRQRDELRTYKPQVKASRFFLSAATSALAVASDVGIRTNPDLMEQSSRELEMQIAALASEIQEIPAIKEHFPHQFRPGNNNEIAVLLYDKIKVPPSPKLGKDKTGRSVTKDHLETVDLPFIDAIINYRRLTKMRDYFGQFRREAVDGTIRASFNLSSGGASTGGSDAGGGPKTFRGSVQNPSLQNVPKRQKDMAKLLRQGFVPRPGNRFGEADYKAVEVAIGACVHKDPMMLKYVTDPSTDMHRDVGMQIFFRGESELSKDERQAAKNGFVFPSFYGSSFENTHRGIWKQTPQATKDHLVKNGIRNINDFKGHIEAIEKDFWKRRFAAYDAWKDETWRFYKRHGFVELPTGFRCFGPMKRTEVINIPIQGPAYHCLLWYKTQVTPLIHGISGRSDVILNIHDSLVTDHHPDDQEEMHRIIWEWGTQRIREHWPWIIVPLTIEAEVSDTDGSWAKLNNVGALDFSRK